ncbi:hypothetical protein RJ639_001120 [Escallonia herrerae]|uniref:Uncharacterized protein n=1 Tax=Escallonia herrerae TaxID=1293975 RepID=A0AA88XA30_9ASTE|nr:hypothetical protein RJ639_001120 [Escallonia herrerae]
MNWYVVRLDYSRKGLIKSPSKANCLDVQQQDTKNAIQSNGFGIDAFDVARELGVPPYLFFTAGAATLSFCFYLPKLDEMVSCEYRDVPEPVEIPGCFPIHFMELEEGAIKALQEEEPGKPPVYVIGPLIGSNKEPERSECLQRLDNQPDGSVLFVSFGSGGTLSYDQINELALGLEMSGQSESVERKEIEKVVKDLMKGEEGNRIRKNMKELQDAARQRRVLDEIFIEVGDPVEKSEQQMMLSIFHPFPIGLLTTG